MVEMAISVLWMLIGLVVLCGVIWLAFYVIETVAGIAIPERIKQIVWVIVLLLIVIAILTILAGGSIGNMHLHR